MSKNELLEKIIATLEADLTTLTEAARTAHTAATHEECIPDNKYDTTALEASYVAQGQANRAQEIRQSLEIYRQLKIRTFDENSAIRLTALVTLEAEGGHLRKVFLGPGAGGLKLLINNQEAIVITPDSPLGRALIGKHCDEEVAVGTGRESNSYTITEIT